MERDARVKICNPYKMGVGTVRRDFGGETRVLDYISIEDKYLADVWIYPLNDVHSKILLNRSEVGVCLPKRETLFFKEPGTTTVEVVEYNPSGKRDDHAQLICAVETISKLTLFLPHRKVCYTIVFFFFILASKA